MASLELLGVLAFDVQPVGKSLSLRIAACDSALSANTFWEGTEVVTEAFEVEVPVEVGAPLAQPALARATATTTNGIL